MKKNLLLLALYTSFFGIVQGQIEWQDLNGNSIDTIEVHRHKNHTDLPLEALIANTNSTTGYYIALKRTFLSYVEGASDQLCYGISCQLGDKNDEEISTAASFHEAEMKINTDKFIHYTPDENDGTSILIYSIYANTDSASVYSNDPVDKLVVKFIVEPYTRITINFRVDLTEVANFDPTKDDAFVCVSSTGDTIKMKAEKEDNVETGFYNKSLDVDGNARYTYKYLAEDVAETAVRPEFTVAEEEMSFNDKFDFVSTIRANNEFENVSIYPNPFSNTVNIKNIDHATHIELTNILGQTVFSTSYVSNSMYIPTGDLNSGLYFIRITDNNNNVYTQRVIKK